MSATHMWLQGASSVMAFMRARGLGGLAYRAIILHHTPFANTTTLPLNLASGWSEAYWNISRYVGCLAL